MARNRIKIENRFPAAKEAMWDAVRAARDNALGEGEHEAERRLERANDSRSYELEIDVQQEKTGFQSGRIVYVPFYGRWFEYGTVHIAAMPFMRPAARKMWKRFVSDLGDEAPKRIRRRARL